MMKYKINIKDCMMLRLCMKRVTQDHIAQKTDMFQKSEIKLELSTLFDTNDIKICHSK